MTISNYGFKIYSLNENNKYSLILMDTHDQGITKIYEINEKNFIFYIDRYIDGGWRPSCRHNNLLLEKVKLDIFKTNDIDKKLNAIKKEGDSDDHFEKKRKLKENEIKNIFESLKFKHIKRKIYRYVAKTIREL